MRQNALQHVHITCTHTVDMEYMYYIIHASMRKYVVLYIPQRFALSRDPVSLQAHGHRSGHDHTLSETRCETCTGQPTYVNTPNNAYRCSSQLCTLMLLFSNEKKKKITIMYFNASIQ